MCTSCTLLEGVRRARGLILFVIGCFFILYPAPTWGRLLCDIRDILPLRWCHHFDEILRSVVLYARTTRQQMCIIIGVPSRLHLQYIVRCHLHRPTGRDSGSYANDTSIVVYLHWRMSDVVLVPPG